MRDHIKIINQMLSESVTFYPATREEKDGEIYIGWPDEYVERVKTDCEDCEKGKVPYHPEIDCPYCQGTGEATETVYRFPHLDVANRNAEIIADMLDAPNPDSGWIAPDEIPVVKRRLMKLMNTSVSQFGVSASTTSRQTRVDYSGDIPRISAGAQMFDAGVTSEQLVGYIRKIMPILDFAQKHGYGVSWA